MNTIETDFTEIISACRRIFNEKLEDYGPTWLLVRFSSIIDELWRKVKRIRTLEENNDDHKIPEGRDVEYLGIINYSIIALIVIIYKDKLPTMEDLFANGSINYKQLDHFYEEIAKEALDLLLRKNHDYGDAWKEMALSSLTDQIIIKIYRIKTILKNDGKVSVSEGIDSQLFDIINYSIFSLIHIKG